MNRCLSEALAEGHPARRSWAQETALGAHQPMTVRARPADPVREAVTSLGTPNCGSLVSLPCATEETAPKRRGLSKVSRRAVQELGPEPAVRPGVGGERLADWPTAGKGGN